MSAEKDCTLYPVPSFLAWRTRIMRLSLSSRSYASWAVGCAKVGGVLVLCFGI